MINFIDSDISLSLIYRGTKDGFEQDDFKEKVWNNERMLIIVKSDTNRIFGGYTPIALKRGGVRKQDGTSFLFSIRDNNELVKCPHRESTDEIH